MRPSAEIPAAWMTGEAAKILVHRWRAEEDAILVGTRTAMLDNPSLTVRAWQGRNPLRVVLDRHLTLAPELNIFNGEARTVLFTAASNKAAAESRFAGKPNVSIEIFGDLEDLLQALRREPYRVQSVMIEGGAQLLNSVIGAGLWDEARVFAAPVSLRELYPATIIPEPKGIPAPILPATPKVTGELPAVGLKIFERG